MVMFVYIKDMINPLWQVVDYLNKQACSVDISCVKLKDTFTMLSATCTYISEHHWQTKVHSRALTYALTLCWFMVN